MATMKATRHEILKEQWETIIKRHNESGLPVRQWCEENKISGVTPLFWTKSHQGYEYLNILNYFASPQSVGILCNKLFFSTIGYK